MEIPEAPDFWRRLPEAERLLALRAERLAGLKAEAFAPYREVLARLPRKEGLRVDLSGAVIRLEAQGDPCPEMEPLLRAFMPWKKGPFHLFGHDVDAEWRSDLKWQRLLPAVGSLKGARVCDIGCHNGYYMFRMAHDRPEFVLGLEPYPKHWFLFQMLNHYIQRPELAFELLGVEHMTWMPKSFDVVFCLGILYHHRDPITLLEGIRKSLRPGGRLFVDCQGIAGADPIALIPRSRYAGASGIWSLPTASALEHWLRRAGFQNIQHLYGERLSPLEQRATDYAPLKSLADFLDPEDADKTIEGYPAPYRFYVQAQL